MKTGHKLLIPILLLFAGFCIPGYWLVSMLVVFMVYVGICLEIICLAEWRMLISRDRLAKGEI